MHSAPDRGCRRPMRPPVYAAGAVLEHRAHPRHSVIREAGHPGTRLSTAKPSWEWGEHRVGLANVLCRTNSCGSRQGRVGRQARCRSNWRTVTASSWANRNFMPTASTVTSFPA